MISNSILDIGFQYQNMFEFYKSNLSHLVNIKHKNRKIH